MNVVHSHVGWWILVAGLVCTIAAGGGAEEFSDARGVESAQRGLREQANFPWYDTEKDQFRRVPVTPQTPPREASDWTISPSVRPRPTKGTGNWGFSIWEVLARILQYAAWILLVGLFVYGVYLAIRAMLASEMSMGVDFADTDEHDLVTEAARIERLPFDLRRPQSDLLEEARRQYEAGNYQEAIIYLFSYQLVQLDKHHWIRLTKGKTNRQYLREIRQQTDLRRLLRGTMVAFEDVFFGHHAIERERFESCWHQLDEFHNLVHSPGSA